MRKCVHISINSRRSVARVFNSAGGFYTFAYNSPLKDTVGLKIRRISGGADMLVNPYLEFRTNLARKDYCS